VRRSGGGRDCERRVAEPSRAHEALLETQPRNKRMQACIFKAGDDIRQDMLAIQIIELFKTILDDVGLDVYLYPYKVIATRPGCGIIEVVPNAKSRDAIGKYLDGNLMDYFISKYGPVNSEPFQRARTNFIQSMAAYAVVSYILQVKDRHNGNILIDDEGHLVHIDFGFIFDISPGGDFGFEVSPFKLSQEMIDVMGGEPGAEQFTYFMEQCVRAFLACRTHMESIITLVELMLETKLPCFKPGCIQRLRERFFPDKSEADAAVAMSAVALKAFSLIPFYTGYYYDVFQKMSQGISF
jgi:phosphatidylinositol 4-kinase